MTTEELLQTLRDGGMDDEAIKSLLGDALASLEGSAEQEENDGEADKASQLLGVEL